MAKPNFTLPNKPAIKSGSILSYNYTDDFTFVPAPLTFNRDSAATRVNEKGLIETVGADQPRIDYSDSLTEPSLLLEPQSTNLITHSEDFSNVAWEYGGDVAIESGYTAPDGSNTAYKVTGTNSNLAINASATSTQTRSIYAKTLSGTGTVQLLSHNSNTNNVFTITPQWQRFEVNSLTSTTGSFYFYAVDFRGASTTLSEVILWGAQLEDLSYATSYIPTAGSTATRLGETANNAGDVNVFNSEEGVLYAEIAALADDGTNRSISLSDGSVNNRISLLFGTSSNRIRAIVKNNNSTSFDEEYEVTSTLNYHKVAIKYKLNNFALWIDSVERFTDTSGSTPIGLNKLMFDVGSGILPFYGKTKDLKVFNKALTDRELEILTT